MILRWYFSLHFQRSLIRGKVLCTKDISLILHRKMRLWYFFREKRFLRACIYWLFIACVLPSKLPSSLIPFSEKEWLKKQKIADLGFCFEFQVVVAVVGFKWRSWGNAKIADLISGNAFNSLPQKNALMSFFNGVGSCFSILHRLWICHAALIV